MFQFTKEELLDLLSKTFDEGHNGYQDLKDCFISKIIEDLEIRKQKAEEAATLWDENYVHGDVFQRTSRPWIIEDHVGTGLPGWPDMSQRDFEELLQRSIGQLGDNNYITNASNSATISPQYVVSTNSANYSYARGHN